MSVSSSRAFARAGAPARLVSIGRQLKRLPRKIRPGAAALARRHPRLAELALSFPALLVALAWPRRGFDPRPVIAGVIAGAPLASLAQRAGVPLWTRKLAPQVLVAPLPVLPDGPFIRRSIVNHLPKQARFAKGWFYSVALAHRWAHDGFAVWCAREFADWEPPEQRGRRPHWSPNRIELLCLWAWHSTEGRGTAASLIETPWQAEMQRDAAWRAADEWHTMVELQLNLAAGALADLRFEPKTVDGYDFVPLDGAAEIVAEAKVMRNCVRTYGGSLAHGHMRLWSLRKDGARVATLSVAWPGSDPFPIIEDLKLAENADAPKEMWWTARHWLASHDLHGFIDRKIGWDSVPLDRAAWRALWKPFWLAKRLVPYFLPLAGSRASLGWL